MSLILESNPSIGRNHQHIHRFLDTVGDGSGIKFAVGDYSLTPTAFKIVPPSDKIYSIGRMIVHIDDDGTVDAGSYGNGIVLTNGIKLHIHDDSGILHDLTDDLPIKTNADWGHFCFDVKNTDFGTGTNTVGARWSFNKYGPNLILDGSKGEWLEVHLNDNFTGLVDHRFMVQGYWFNS